MEDRFHKLDSTTDWFHIKGLPDLKTQMPEYNVTIPWSEDNWETEDDVKPVHDISFLDEVKRNLTKTYSGDSDYVNI